METGEMSLRDQMVADSNYFKKMLSLIPPGYSSSLPEDGNNSNEKLHQFDSREDLQDTLNSKIKELQAKRLKNGAAVDSIEKKRLKRKLSKQKLRQRRKAEKQQMQPKQPARSKKVAGQAPKPIFNKEGKMVFSKFDFSGDHKKDKSVGQKQTVGGHNKMKILLKQAEEKKEKMSALEMTDAERAKEMSHKEHWKIALSKAEGAKVRDNAELLKKTMKRQEKKKEQSQQKWAEREESLQKRMKEKHDKRTQNIAKKKEGLHNKKVAKQKKRGRIVAS